ncbi:hypothetical protein [Streptomyces griseoviridis]|uniref:Uncharacterized protein n=1 Tax=Streptomyces griseoviridis TaxID=45398 RepID=A0ABT9LI13_STRGD|nr:hypothetical protein [Streptomyces griseoviridis]MDP9682387.1 hypothetical protein [Streptomyces griseoviridis]GGS81827.1 hypothetical protein GCM10010240_13990 [Streptomyces griseoviridis]
MPDPLAPVALRVEVEINGQTYGQQWAVPRREWEAIQQDEKLRATYENMLRAHLGAAVMEQLQPPVTVHMPTELDEAVMQRTVADLEQQGGD